MTGLDVDAVALEEIEVGAGGHACGGGVPELVVADDVFGPENHPASAVVDDQ